MTPEICSDPVMLEQFRALLGFGLVLTGGMLMVDYVRYMSRPIGKVEKPIYCPLHRTDRNECEEKHRDD